MTHRSVALFLLALTLGAARTSWAQGADAPAAGLQDDTVRLVLAGDTLVGSLMRPRGMSPARTPIAVLHPGSGGTTRDGNTQGMSPSNALKQFAESLSAHGIATLRIDKRGIGASARALKAMERFTIDGYITDAVAWVAELRRAGWKQVVLMGHSEGALILSEAARRTPVEGLVLLAGAGRPADDVLREQLAARAPAAMAAAVDTVLRAMKTTDGPVVVPAAAQALIAPPIVAYMRSWIRLDPAASVAAVSAPVLVLQGETDLQVSVADARRLAAAHPAATLVLVPGVNHMLRVASGTVAEQMASYTTPAPAAAGAAVSPVVRFVQSLRPVP